jgi:hypothetical protein
MWNVAQTMGYIGQLIYESVYFRSFAFLPSKRNSLYAISFLLLLRIDLVTVILLSGLNVFVLLIG